MKELMLVLGFVLLVNTAFADCTVNFPKPRDASMSLSYVSDRTYHQILDILADKGYIVLTAEELKVEKPNYNLKVRGYYGYGCGTGLTFIDYLTVPAYNSIEFSGNGIDVDVEKSFSSSFGVKSIAKKHLMKTIKALPQCEG